VVSTVSPILSPTYPQSHSFNFLFSNLYIFATNISLTESIDPLRDNTPSTTSHPVYLSLVHQIKLSGCVTVVVLCVCENMKKCDKKVVNGGEKVKKK